MYHSIWDGGSIYFYPNMPNNIYRHPSLATRWDFNHVMCHVIHTHLFSLNIIPFKHLDFEACMSFVQFYFFSIFTIIALISINIFLVPN
ncbi:hypothetical protein QL285_071135 [Trifolium repens]|nr:hypothetical protein QL285_071135 [Trifolium repens]